MVHSVSDAAFTPIIHDRSKAVNVQYKSEEEVYEGFLRPHLAKMWLLV